MSVRAVRKAIGLLALDFVIIIGIFILQFRTDSNIIQKIGNLQINLAKTEENSEQEASEKSLQNKLLVSYNGAIFQSNEHILAKATFKGESSPKDVELVDYIIEDLSSTFIFNDDIKLTFTLADESLTAPLTIKAILPKNVTDLYLPYSFAKNMTIQQDDGNKVVLNGKKNLWLFSTDVVNDGFIHFSKHHTNTHYAIYDNTKKFTFESLVELASASQEALKNTISSLKENLIQAFKINSIETNITEPIVVSYVAAMSQDGNFQQAIDEIPTDFKKGNKRTYLSAPYFNTLVNMNKQLDEKLEKQKTLISSASKSLSLDIFTESDLAFYLSIHPSSDEVTTLLQNAASVDISVATIAQTAGILQCFTELSEFNAKYAQLLLPILNSCVEKIQDSCKYETEVLSLSENDTFLSVIQAIKTGISLMRYGQLVQNDVFEKAGIVLINSYIADSSSFDLRTLANLYSLFAYDNSYYPHFKLIDASIKNPQWAWTCANNISKEITDDELSISIDFPEKLTHYVILKGIPSFETIYIYDMAFRTDHRFETYNSSGYVFESKTNTLLLKSRHKSDPEIIRMSYKKEEKIVEPVKNNEEKVSEEVTTTNQEEPLIEQQDNTENNTGNNTEQRIDPNQFLPPSMRRPTPPIPITE